jgi:hypothetical protein
MLQPPKSSLTGPVYSLTGCTASTRAIAESLSHELRERFVGATRAPPLPRVALRPLYSVK